jgi:Uma2 family endonuclease
MTAAEYIEREIEKERRQEYVDGQVFALSGGTTFHCKLLLNLAVALMPAADRMGCSVFSQSVRVRVAARNSYYYPDVVVTCERSTEDTCTICDPCFIAEVLSPSTASVDRREKRLAYTSLECLKEYVMVYQDRFRVDIYRRAGESWNLEILREPQQAVEVSCLACSVTIEEIYRGIHLPLHISEAVAATFDDEWDLELRPVPEILLTKDEAVES